MPQIDHRETIQRPVFDVFKLAGDFERWDNWQDGVTDVSLIAADPIRPGTSVTIRRNMMGRNVFINADVVEYDRHKRIVLKGVQGLFPFNRTIAFQSQGRETLIIDSLSIRTGFMYFWYGPILAASLRKQLQNDWGTLKQMLESGNGQMTSPPTA
jgi:hypothetical protein